MARIQRLRRLNDAKSEVIAENVLKQNPEGHASTEDVKIEQVVIAKKMPEYRRIIFINGRDPGYPLDFHYSSSTHPLKKYTLFHGFEHELPIEIIEHLESCAECQYGYRKGVDGHPEMYVSGKKYLYQFRNPPKKAA